MDDIEVPEFFICPISLQIMKDPVTAITGITYDRQSIERWLFVEKNSTCPLTKQRLPIDSDLTPNHILRRLIQAWCVDNASNGVDRIPTPKSPLTKLHVLKLVEDLQRPKLQMKTLRQLEVLAAENERNRKHMVEAGVSKAVLVFIIACFEKRQIVGLQEALTILRFIRIPAAETKILIDQNDQIIESLTWVLALGCELDNHATIKSHSLSILKKIIQTASSRRLESVLKPEFFQTIIGILRNGITQQGLNAALHILLDSCSRGSRRNRKMAVEAGAVFQLIEMELETPERRTTEVILGILFHLCSCAEGRAQFLSHRGGLAVVSKRILMVSPAADDRAVLILSLICKFCGMNCRVIQEMLKVGAVSKLGRLLRVDCASYLKDKAREILRSHSDEWKNSACIGEFLLKRYPN